MSSKQEKWLTQTQVAALLGISFKRVDQLRVIHRFPSVRLCECGGSHMINEIDISKDSLARKQLGATGRPKKL